MAELHSMKDGKATWCGIQVSAEEGREVPLIAGDRASVTCKACLTAMPELPKAIMATGAVKVKLAEEAARFDSRKAAPKFDPDAEPEEPDYRGEVLRRLVTDQSKGV